MCDWVCYLIASLDSYATYVGASNNQPKRLDHHNNCDPTIKRKGAKRTANQTWIPVVIVSGFESKNACLSFEAGWKRLARRRNMERLFLLNEMSGLHLAYGGDQTWNRILDLLFFVCNLTIINEKFKLNVEQNYPMIPPDQLKLTVFLEDSIQDLPWPYFVKVKLRTNVF